MSQAARRAQGRAIGFSGDFGGGNYRKWWDGLSKSKQNQKTSNNPISDFEGGGRNPNDTSGSGSGGNAGRDFGDNVDYNKHLAQATGYQGDFGSGGFVKFWQGAGTQKRTNIKDTMRDNPYRDYGNNPEMNKALAEQFPGFVQNFGEGQFSRWYTQSAPTKKENVDEYLEEEWNWDSIIAANKTGTPVDQKGNPKPKQKSGAKPLSGNNKLNPGAAGGVRRRRLLG